MKEKGSVSFNNFCILYSRTIAIVVVVIIIIILLIKINQQRSPLSLILFLNKGVKKIYW
jgi:hypothetical protein